ncbi:inositol monophosphatase [Curtobacterium sp. MCBD17_013]|uniref:inositol monophosphatase family protein n=1 Tax=unclassified Curtobacterium TaxID=257496 RepID=UPI000DA72218|nr:MULTISPECIES: inositol monophosphatase family protein [unclassified Curtobacterium]PZF64334.1 inositol monophosphatase [Curtobacterium sp. MCBD17_013]WIB62686.1 inositol monophosphatase family protein [Curtobacterium sp. MCBD17_040]WIB66523.1 inositol monophosphatase family protein [Curtobacterium sp. MCBD17_035]
MPGASATVSVPELADIAESIGRDAAALAQRRRTEGVEVTDRKSSLVDVVTAADREVEAMIRRRIAEVRPDDGFLGEETGTSVGSSGLTWVVDPIDGTVNYLYGSPSYGVSIAVVEGEPHPARWSALAGVVVAPATGDVHRAERGRGAWLNGRPLHVGAPASLAESLVATGFGYTAERRRDQVRVLAGLITEVRDIRRGGAASLDLCAVATGTVDAYYERGINPWDMAAGALVAAEAGATVESWDSGDARGYVVAAPVIAGALVELVRGLEGTD